MNIQFSYKSVNQKDKTFLENYIDKKIDRIKKLLKKLDFENAILETRVEKFVKKEAYKVEIHLNFPGETLMASEDDHTVIEAFDLALDKLIKQLRKFRESNKNTVTKNKIIK
jgi:putative sigma-54 modulation protein